MMCINAFAATNANSTSVYLSFSGTNANCNSSVRGRGTINATMELWQGTTLVASWSCSGTGYVAFHETATAISGKSYSLKLSGTINGTSFNATPSNGTCP